MKETAETYARWTRWFRASASRTRALRNINSALTLVGYIAYPLLLVLEVFLSPDLLVRSVVVPAVGFILCTLVRAGINAPRPYETLDIEPLIHKDTRGNSMPSRHAFCMFMIAGSWLIFFKPVAFLLLAIGCILAIVRVLGGVHFPKDVIAGALAALIWGHICYIMLPIW